MQALLAVPNVTAHPSTANVPVSVLLYSGPLLCGFISVSADLKALYKSVIIITIIINVSIKGLRMTYSRDLLYHIC